MGISDNIFPFPFFFDKKPLEKNVCSQHFLNEFVRCDEVKFVINLGWFNPRVCVPTHHFCSLEVDDIGV